MCAKCKRTLFTFRMLPLVSLNYSQLFFQEQLPISYINMKIGNFFLASIFLQSFLIVCAEEKTEVNVCQEYAGRNEEFKVEYGIEPNETITNENGDNYTVGDLGDALVSCIWSFGSDKNCTYQSKISESGQDKSCDDILTSPRVSINETKCVLEFSETSSVTNMITEKRRHHPSNTFM